MSKQFSFRVSVPRTPFYIGASLPNLSPGSQSSNYPGAGFQTPKSPWFSRYWMRPCRQPFYTSDATVCDAYSLRREAAVSWSSCHRSQMTGELPVVFQSSTTFLSRWTESSPFDRSSPVSLCCRIQRCFHSRTAEKSTAERYSLSR